MQHWFSNFYNRGYDAAYGARPLKHVIQWHDQDPRAEQILAGGVKVTKTETGMSPVSAPSGSLQNQSPIMACTC